MLANRSQQKLINTGMSHPFSPLKNNTTDFQQVALFLNAENVHTGAMMTL